MGKIAVLGTGPSIELFLKSKVKYDYVIGVNDIYKFTRVDALVCVDKRVRFTDERAAIIDMSKPRIFYSQLDEWNYRPDFRKINLQVYYPNYVCQLDLKEVPKSMCSPFVACAIAYKYHGASEIDVYGVDMNNHPKLKGKTLEKIKTHFINLNQALSQVGVKMTVYGNGILNGLW